MIALGLEPVFNTEKVNHDYQVLPENWPAVQLLIKCQTQWKKTVVSSMAGVVVVVEGLDYVAVNILIDTFYHDEDRTDLWRRLQVLEREAVGLLNA